MILPGNARIYHGGSFCQRSWGGVSSSQVNLVAWGQKTFSLDDVTAMPGKTLVVDNSDATLWSINWSISTEILGEQIYISADSTKCVPGKPLTIEFSRSYGYSYGSPYDPARFLLVGFDQTLFNVKDTFATASDTETLTPNRVIDEWTRVYAPYDVAPWHVVRWCCTFSFIYKSEYESTNNLHFLLTSVIRNKDRSKLNILEPE